MNEIPALFGSDHHLVGVATFPTDGGHQAPVACLMLNFGVTQRIGPHRINVKLARRLASQGVASFRFDLSGVGDSGRSGSALDHRQQAVVDLKAAMDHCQTTWGLSQFAVLGLCSGSVHGYSLSMEDARVVALLIFDAFSYRTRASDVARAWQRLWALPRNPAVLDKARRWVKRFSKASKYAAVDIYGASRWQLSHDDFEQAVEGLLDRRVALFFLYTGTLHSVDHGKAQLGRLRNARFLKHVRYEFMADVDHTVTSLAAQERVLDAACNWIGDVVSGKARPRPDEHRSVSHRSGQGSPASDSAVNQLMA